MESIEQWWAKEHARVVGEWIERGLVDEYLNEARDEITGAVTSVTQRREVLVDYGRS